MFGFNVGEATSGSGSDETDSPNVVSERGPEPRSTATAVPAGDLVLTVHQPIYGNLLRSAEPPGCPIRLLLTGMDAGYQARVAIYDTGTQSWGIGAQCDLLVGASVKSLVPGTPLVLGRFVMNASELLISVAQACPQIEVSLYVDATVPMLRGVVELSQGGVVTVESPVDRTSVTGHSSFSIALR
ncbi:hypothetical protein WKR88_26110 [Trinickia caryophylli]|uniref:Uncharacterized protein n=1 Tax=Trinickia caryophylli TaxID=28094 RepID=A0A1X7GA20_TRICW|nr:hypothetical protein [Trinickia caryophylli]PMS11364.1 hypothetical protein C0Z17_14560 [Trinickia caryophylli]TRX17557.1 hypothetical protein FNF07_04480 [Trinickia caryophylli]WQE11693.1 hypothetical protein U0034_18430 [Trinickia caryophylli]SMF66529.1 hypothetical protein SAMN06295900_114126 [Trinickia caryophylli]GLU34879.1 hypothetical protein Busp01_47210 [Trinickia caryophylli]